MKSIFSNTSFWGLNVLLGLFICTMSFTSCNDNDSNESSPITIKKVYLEDASSSVPDREVTFARLGQLLRIEGSGFTGLKRVYINGYSTYFNPVFLSENSILISISKETPIKDIGLLDRNRIKFIKDGAQASYRFEIRSSAPTVTRISHTMPLAGETITIYGEGLVGVNRITFPGNIVATSNITSDEDGEFCTVVVPAGITESGAVFVEGTNGGAYSPAYFNFKKGLLHNFDNVNNHGWSGGEVSEDLEDKIPASGDGPKSQGKYRSLNKDKKTFAAPAPKASYYWANNSVFPSLLPESVISSATSTSDVGVQVDIYAEGEWNSGTIRIVIADGSSADRYCMLYTPWLENGKKVPFINPGSWFTITLPFSDSEDYAGKTLQDVFASVSSASYAQWGPWFDNIDINDIACEPTDVTIYFDNLRVVPLDTPTYTDYPEEEE